MACNADASPVSLICLRSFRWSVRRATCRGRCHARRHTTSDRSRQDVIRYLRRLGIPEGDASPVFIG